MGVGEEQVLSCAQTQHPFLAKNIPCLEEDHQYKIEHEDTLPETTILTHFFTKGGTARECVVFVFQLFPRSIATPELAVEEREQCERLCLEQR